MTLIAGANFTQAASTVTITGQNQTGDNIDLANSTGVTTATTAGGNFSGGNFTALAFNGGVNLQGVPLTTGGAGSGANGNVVIIAGGSGGGSGALFGENNGSITTTGGTGGGGNITVQTATPNTSPNLVISTTTPTFASITTGNPINSFGSNNFLNTSISVTAGTNAGFTVGNAAINLQSGGGIALQTVSGAVGSTLNLAADLALATQQSINFNGAVNVSQITGTVLKESTNNNNNITIGAALTAPGGILFLSGGEISSSWQSQHRQS